MAITFALKVCCLVALVVLIFFGLGPAHLQPRSGVGWQFDHFVGYVILTFIFCIAWGRSLVVASALALFAVVLGGPTSAHDRPFVQCRGGPSTAYAGSWPEL
jgi:hypothetical protein